jgi:hypothetical protein
MASAMLSLMDLWLSVAVLAMAAWLCLPGEMRGARPRPGAADADPPDEDGAPPAAPRFRSHSKHFTLSDGFSGSKAPVSLREGFRPPGCARLNRPPPFRRRCGGGERRW